MKALNANPEIVAKRIETCWTRMETHQLVIDAATRRDAGGQRRLLSRI
jgi:hypothetical protein